MLKAVEKKRAYEDIVKQIFSLIEKGKLKRGDQLPVERELSETFKVSRATVREAIFSLESMRLVQRRQGTGLMSSLRVRTPWCNPWRRPSFMEKDDIIDIFFVRKIIEPEVAQLASENRTPEEIDELEECVRKQAKEVESGENPVDTDSEFHHLLARMARNKVLERLLVTLVDLLGKTREKYLQTEERKQKSLHGHYEILGAIKNGDGRAARKVMLRHLEDVENAVFSKRKGGGRRPWVDPGK